MIAGSKCRHLNRAGSGLHTVSSLSDPPGGFATHPTITLADITEEELRVMELIEAEQKENIAAEDRDAKSFQELLIRKLSRR